jgi:signal transduction histidine kinase
VRGIDVADESADQIDEAGLLRDACQRSTPTVWLLWADMKLRITDQIKFRFGLADVDPASDAVLQAVFEITKEARRGRGSRADASHGDQRRGCGSRSQSARRVPYRSRAASGMAVPRRCSATSCRRRRALTELTRDSQVRFNIRVSAPSEDEFRAAIWIVDDSPLQAELSREALASAFDVVVFLDAGPLLERLATNQRPDVLIVDWHMPNVSGLDVCTFVRTMANASELPILFLTASEDRDDVLAGLGAGANDFVKKPFRAEELNARVASLARGSRLHQKLADAELDLREEAAFRERFMAILAHDLRQPLNVFVMGSGLLAESGGESGPLGIVSKRFANAASRMQRMLDEMLDFSRSRHHHGIPIERKPSDVAEVAARIVAEVALAHPNRQIGLEVHGDCTGDWDADRVAQVFSNLVGNALVHSATTFPVCVSVHADDVGVDIEVENRCARIPETVLATIFEPFRQGAASRAGLGLGLYIVRQIVRAHGGEVSVDSGDTRTLFTARLLRSTPARRSSRPGPP